MNNKKYTILAMSALLMFGLTTFADAATYEYVNTNGTISTINADSADQAITTATNRAMGSGVILVTGNESVVTSSTNTQFGYVNESGVVVTVDANTSSQAFSESNNISDHSGVILINSTSDQNLVGESVPVK